jgi:hypothetical protein
MSLLLAASALLLAAPQAPPKMPGAPPTGSVGMAPRGFSGMPGGGNVGVFPGGSVGSFPRGNAGFMTGGNIGRFPGGNTGVAPSGAVGFAPGGNVGVSPTGRVGSPPRGAVGAIPTMNVDRDRRGNVDAIHPDVVSVYPLGKVERFPRGNVEVAPGLSGAKEDWIKNGGMFPKPVGERQRSGYDADGNPIKPKKAAAKQVDPAPQPVVLTAGAAAALNDLESALAAIDETRFAYQGRRASAAANVVRAIDQMRFRQVDPKKVAAVGYGRNDEPRDSADAKMLYARAKLTTAYARLVTARESKDEAAVADLKRSLDAVDAALSLPRAR